jgi:hypothetical protein
MILMAKAPIAPTFELKPPQQPSHAVKTLSIQWLTGGGRGVCDFRRLSD